jgi:hypothetical protein
MLTEPARDAIRKKIAKNPASRRLLEKLGARLVNVDESSTSWELTR